MMKVRELIERLQAQDPDLLVAVVWNHLDSVASGVTDVAHVEVLMVDEDGEVDGVREYANEPTVVIHGLSHAHAAEEETG